MAMPADGVPTADGARPVGTAEKPTAPRLARRRALWPTALASFSAVQGMSTVVLAILNGRGRTFLLDQTATLVVLSVTFAGIGAVLAARRPRNPLGWLLLGGGMCQGLLAFCEEYAVRALLVAPGSLPLGAEASWLKEWIWVPGLGMSLVFLPLLFPDGRPPSAPWWAAAWLGGAATLLGCVSAGWPVWQARGPALLAEGGTAEYTVAPGWARLTDLGIFPLLLLASLGALASLVVRFRRASPEQRAPLLWFLTAVAVTIAATLLLQVVPTEERGALQVGLVVVGMLAAPSIPVAVGAAVLMRRLPGFDVVVQRTLVYGALVGLVTGGYVLVVAVVGRLFSAEDQLFVALLATGAVAVAFAPARTRVQRAASRLVYGDRDEPYAALSRLVRRTGSAVEPRAVVKAVAETVARAVRTSHVAVELGRPGTGRPAEAVAELGRPVGTPLAFPLEHRNEPLGRLVVSPRAPGERFDPAERRLLADLARQAAPAVHAVQLALELQTSRERLVGAREEERRRLRRTLHDEVGPTLSSAVLKLAAVRRLLPEGSPADHLLDELRGDLRSTVRDVRTLAYDLRPPTLDQLGLEESLTEFVESRRDAGDDGWALPVAIEADPDLPPLPAAVEVAAYWIAREALTNVVRHAEAGHCRVTLTLCGPVGRRELVLTVADDGRGLPPARPTGVGTAAMRERAEELGGTLLVTSSATGTQVTARLPAERVPG